MNTVVNFLPSLTILIQTFSIWYSFYTLGDHGHHPMVMLDFAESLFYSTIIHVFDTYYLLDTGLDSGEHLFLFNKHLHITFYVLGFFSKYLISINTFNHLTKPMIWVLLLSPLLYEKNTTQEN